MQQMANALETLYDALSVSLFNFQILWTVTGMVVGGICLFLVIAHPRLALRGAAIGAAGGVLLCLWPVLSWEHQAAAGIRQEFPFLYLMRESLTDEMVIVVLALCPILGAGAGGSAGLAARLRVRSKPVLGVIGQMGVIFTGLLLTGVVLEPYLSSNETLPPLVASTSFVIVYFFPALLVVVVIVALVTGTLAGLFRTSLPLRSSPVSDNL